MTSRWLSHPVMRHLAPYSYAFYLFHYMPITHYLAYFGELEQRGLQLLAPVLLFAGTYAASRLSHSLIEQPFLRLKSRFDTSRKPVEAGS